MLHRLVDPLDLERDLILSESIARMRHHLQQGLSPQQTELLALRYDEQGLTLKAVAERLRRSPQQVRDAEKKALRRAARILRSRMGPDIFQSFVDLFESVR